MRAPKDGHEGNPPKDLGALLVGPSPPPYSGMSVATELLVGVLRQDFKLAHLDTADRRGLSNVGKLELGNLLLAGRHAWECLWLLLTRRPRVVYVPISQAWLPFLRDCLFLIPARLLGRKIVIHLHGGYFGRFYRQTSSVMRMIIRFALGSASLAIVLGENVADAFDGVVPREKVRIVPNGIPDSFADRTPPDAAGRDDRPPNLLYLSTLVAEKGFLDLLRALPQVKEHAGAVEAVFAGEWYSKQDKDEAQRLVDSFQMAELVRFVGPVGHEEKSRLLEGAAVFILPSRNEGHPYVILEAMAAGLPVVSTNVACIPETIRDGVEGFLVESGDVEGLADRITRLVRDASLRKRMGQAARQRFLEEYTYDKFAERMRAVFAEVLQPDGEISTALPAHEELSEPAARQR